VQWGTALPLDSESRLFERKEQDASLIIEIHCASTKKHFKTGKYTTE